MEKELKLLIAAALQGAASAERQRYLSVRDKRLNGADIDLLAFMQPDPSKWSKPVFWAEFKCSFLEAGVEAAFSVATDALAQAWRYSEKLRKSDWIEFEKFAELADELRGFREQLLASPVYIVHFLNSKPAIGCGLPEVIMQKFPQCRHPVTPHELEAYYRLGLTPEEQHDSIEGPEPGNELIVRQAELRERGSAFERARLARLSEELTRTPNGDDRKLGKLRKRIADIECAIKMKRRLEASSIIHVVSEPQLYAVVTRYRALTDLRDSVATTQE